MPRVSYKILYIILYFTGNQCSNLRILVIRLCLGVRVKMRAAEFWIFCNLEISSGCERCHFFFKEKYVDLHTWITWEWKLKCLSKIAPKLLYFWDSYILDVPTVTKRLSGLYLERVDKITGILILKVNEWDQAVWPV